MSNFDDLSQEISFVEENPNRGDTQPKSVFEAVAYSESTKF